LSKGFKGLNWGVFAYKQLIFSETLAPMAGTADAEQRAGPEPKSLFRSAAASLNPARMLFEREAAFARCANVVPDAGFRRRALIK
jgi:hypothetical protein